MQRALVPAAAAAPFAIGALLPVDTVLDGPSLCPFRALTGLPCPLCGATRAVVLAAHGDGRWLHYGAAWVVILALVATVALVWRPRGRLLVGGVLAATAVGWTWALAHAGAITSSA